MLPMIRAKMCKIYKIWLLLCCSRHVFVLRLRCYNHAISRVAVTWIPQPNTWLIQAPRFPIGFGSSANMLSPSSSISRGKSHAGGVCHEGQHTHSHGDDHHREDSHPMDAWACVSHDSNWWNHVSNACAEGHEPMSSQVYSCVLVYTKLQR